MNKQPTMMSFWRFAPRPVDDGSTVITERSRGSVFLTVALTGAAWLVALAATAAVPAAETVAPDDRADETVTVFLIGDSTVKNGRGDGSGGLWGWGQVLQKHFDYERARVENRAIGGRSSRTYLTEGRWDKVLEGLGPGDFVLMQFGHNDGGELFRGDRPRASLKGSGAETTEGVVEQTGQSETVHTYGWYLRRYIADTLSKGATPIVLSPVPRDRWRDGRVERASGDYAAWAAQAAEQAGAFYVDLNSLVADRYEQRGQQPVHDEYFTPTDHTHTSRLGAEVNAECVVAGIRLLDGCKLREFLLPDKEDVRARLDLSDRGGGEPFTVSVQVPEGNHLVRVRFGSPSAAGNTTVEAELRRRLTDPVVTRSGEFIEREFLVNTRTPVLPNGRRMRLKPRELSDETIAWDARLTLRFSGPEPWVAGAEVLPAPAESVTVYLLGDSTVADQFSAPWASWGQKLPRYFGPTAAVANHAESGETIAASWSRGRCDKILESIAPGDWLLVQFGHNDMKSDKPDALDRYRRDMTRLVVAARDRGARPVLVTSMERMAGVTKNTLGGYPEAVRQIAKEQSVPLIDLHAMSQRLYAELGERLPSAFQDPTHHNDFGAELLAACVVDGIAAEVPDLARRLKGAAPVRP